MTLRRFLEFTKLFAAISLVCLVLAGLWVATPN